MSKLRLLQESAAAEKAWMLEAAAVLGERDAQMARYQDRANGEPGSRLRELYKTYIAARDAYQSAS
ncbi:MAG TPA: hypothetical protein VGJ91_10795 [Polyangiaceae bacterium]|jgi:hypothetical protein